MPAIYAGVLCQWVVILAILVQILSIWVCFFLMSGRDKVTHFLHSAPPQVAFSEEFYSLSLNQLTEIISHDELDVKEETTVWEAVVRWVQHSREDRWALYL